MMRRAPVFRGCKTIPCHPLVIRSFKETTMMMTGAMAVNAIEQDMALITIWLFQFSLLILRHLGKDNASCC